MVFAALASGLVAALVALHAFGFYAVALVALSAVARRARSTDMAATPALRVAALVVAHDEERVVADSVTSLLAQRYSGALDVLVVADHCSDRTADVARQAGARVLERTSGRPEGKSAAVAFGVQAIAQERSADAIAIFDADNVVDPGFCARIAARLAGGERVVQGFVDAKNPAASWVAGSSALGFWALEAIAQRPRERLGLSTPLMGTGFAMRTDDARELLSTEGSLTDDLELGARLAANGVRVAYEGGARTIDEKPVALATAVTQRHRWMQGRWSVASRHLPGLVAGALRPGALSLTERLRRFDGAVQLVSPSLLFTAVGGALTTTLLATCIHLSAPAGLRASTEGWLLGSLVASGLYFFLPAFGIAKHRPPAKVWMYYVVQPAYLALSAPLAVSGWLRRRRTTWRRTPKGLP